LAQQILFELKSIKSCVFIFSSSISTLLSAIPDGSNATESLDWMDKMRKVVEASRPSVDTGGGILDEPELLPTDSELADDHVVVELPSNQQVLETLNRVDRDLREQQQLVMSHRRLDSDDDDDEEKRALKQLIRLLEPAYYGLNGLVRTIITKVATTGQESKTLLERIDAKLDLVSQRVELHLNFTSNQTELLQECVQLAKEDPQVANMFAKFSNLAKATLDNAGFGDLLRTPNVWFSQLSGLVIHFFDSQLASFFAYYFGIRRATLTKLSVSIF
jgi:hypothetical protein